MRRQLAKLVDQHPYVCGVAGALAVYLALTLPVGFTFMADDWGHLAAAEQLPHLYADRFSAWLARVPVWSVLAWLIFDSHVFERTWAPMYLVFAAHAGAVALIARWLLRQLDGNGEQPAARSWVIAFATGAGALYPNVYEILYWPTCMPYAVGGLFVAAALYARTTVAKTVLAALAFLTYETFLLPTLALMLAPAVLNSRPSEGQAKRVREIMRYAVPWFGALAVMLVVRGVASKYVGAFQHRVNANLGHAMAQVLVSAKQLFQIRFFGSGTNELATGVMLGVVIAASALLWRRWRWRSRPVILLAASLLSTSLYWVLDYNAMRAIYGAQIMFVAAMIWLVVQASRTGVRPVAVGAALLALAAGFVGQSVSVMRIKDHNAQVLAVREASLAAKIEACNSTCVVPYEDLDAGLAKDWVLHRHYWHSYLERLHYKYGRNKHIEFVSASPARE